MLKLKNIQSKKGKGKSLKKNRPYIVTMEGFFFLQTFITDRQEFMA